ncbi:MAG TPA: TfoX/Sxy family protein [Myxococcaceae bacterium]|nr:TfoX/Sxy family protein [Myxococcaceae bacterium]
MKELPSFVQHSLDLLAGAGPIRARSMFGGYGLSVGGISMGLIDEDRLYLRVDDETREQFQAAGSDPFVYQTKNGPMTMKSYWSLPEEALDDPEAASRWGRLAVEASRRAEAAKRKPARAVAKAKPELAAKPVTKRKVSGGRAKVSGGKAKVSGAKPRAKRPTKR